MNEELLPAPETNPYVPNVSLRATGTWIPDVGGLPVKLIVLGITTFLGGMFLLGMAPAAGAIDYTRDIPITEVIEYMMKANWRQVLQHGPIWILPVCALGLVCYMVAPARLRFVVYIYHAIFALLFAPLAFLVLLKMPWILIDALCGRADGEDWSEGMINFGAIGYWSLMWLILLGTAWIRSRMLGRSRAIEGKV